MVVGKNREEAVGHYCSALLLNGTAHIICLVNIYVYVPGSAGRAGAGSVCTPRKGPAYTRAVCYTLISKGANAGKKCCRLGLFMARHRAPPRPATTQPGDNGNLAGRGRGS